MKLKNIGVVPLAASTALFVVSAPANAAGLEGQLDLVWNAGAYPNRIEFYTSDPGPVIPILGDADDGDKQIGDIFVTNATGGFSSLRGMGGIVKDLDSIPLSGNVNKWLDFRGASRMCKNIPE